MVQILEQGLCYCSVCVPKDMTKLDIEQGTNLQVPTGIPSRWRISKDKNFNTGQSNPCPCESYPETRIHYLLNC